MHSTRPRYDLAIAAYDVALTLDRGRNAMVQAEKRAELAKERAAASAR